jgi:hypothetical protein
VPVFLNMKVGMALAIYKMNPNKGENMKLKACKVEGTVFEINGKSVLIDSSFRVVYNESNHSNREVENLVWQWVYGTQAKGE